jgi:Universal stress protein family
LILMHAMSQAEPTKENRSLGPSVAEVMHALYETVPKGADIPSSPEVDLEFGEASKQIVKAAKERNAHLIVLGVRSAQGHLQAPTHSGCGVAHMVAADGTCPVLMVRAQSDSFFFESLATWGSPNGQGNNVDTRLNTSECWATKRRKSSRRTKAIRQMQSLSGKLIGFPAKNGHQT